MSDLVTHTRTHIKERTHPKDGSQSQTVSRSSSLLHFASCVACALCLRACRCQTKLADLYKELPGCTEEFAAYRFLYDTVTWCHQTFNLARSLEAAADVIGIESAPVGGPRRPEDTATGAVANALAARAALAGRNYPAFFKAYAEGPGLGRALLDLVVGHVRVEAIVRLLATNGPNTKALKKEETKEVPPPPPPPTLVPLTFVARVLGFSVKGAGAQQGAAGVGAPAEAGAPTPLPGCRHAVYVGKAAAAATEEAAVVACAEWLRAHGATVIEDEGAACMHTHLALAHIANRAYTHARAHTCAYTARHGAWRRSIVCTMPLGLHFASFMPVVFLVRVFADGSPLYLDITASRGKIVVPLKPTKVTHGDENLSLEDFALSQLGDGQPRAE